MKRLCATLTTAALAAFSSVAWAGTDLAAGYPFFKELATSNTPSAKVASVLIDEDMFDATDAGYANLRVIDDRNVEIPRLVRRQTLKKISKHERAADMRILSFEKKPDNSVEIVGGTNTGGRLISALILHSGMRNFEKSVSVYGSDDRQTWRQVAAGQPIFDYSRFIDVRNNRIELGQGNFRFYRIELSNITESRQSPFVQISRQSNNDNFTGTVENTSFTAEDFRIEKIDFMEVVETVVESEPVTRSYEESKLAVTNDLEKKITAVTFDTTRAPLTELRLETAGENFSRRVVIEARNDETYRDNIGVVRDVWRTIAESTISSINIDSFRQSSISVRIEPAQRFTHYRVTIINHDSPPLEISGVSLKGEVHEALFFCDPARGYRVFFGGDTSKTPSYDITDVLMRTGPGTTHAYYAGAKKANAAYKTPGKSTISGKKLLAPALIIMALALLWLIFSTVKKVE